MIGQSMITVSVSSGLGNHIHLLTGPQISKAVFWSWLAQSFAIFAIGFGKIAVIAFILRIQDRANNRTAAFLTYFLYLIAVSNVIMNIVQVALIWTQCAPAAKLWNRLLPGTCGGVLRTTHVGFFQGSKYTFIAKVCCSHADGTTRLGCHQRCGPSYLPSANVLEPQDLH